MTVLIFAIILSFLVLIHELGHFLVARWAKIRVEEFGLGFPPKAKTLYTDKRGTEYTLNWLPFGGFVRLYGEDGEASVDKPQKGEAFFNKPVWKRMLVVLAGAAVNFAFGVVAFGAIYTYVGIPTNFPFAKVEEIAQGSPADQSNLQVGDEVVGIIDAEGEAPVGSVGAFIEEVNLRRGQEVSLRLNNRPEMVPIYIRSTEETPENEGALGVVISDFDLVRYPYWEMPFRGMVVGTQSAVEFGALLVSALGTMVADLVTQGVVPEDVAGPIGIAHIAGREEILTRGFIAQLNFAAILSINLAIVNVLPIPAVDGGRMVFLLIEGITRRRVKPKIEHAVNAMGFMFLITLLILISVRDIRMVAMDEGVRSWFRGLF